MNLIHNALGAQILEIRLSNFDLLYKSPLIKFDENSSIRGGIPILFPQFGNLGNIRKHGFARDLNWRLVYEKCNKKYINLEYELIIKGNQIDDWVNSAKLNLITTLENKSLKIDLQITNIGISTFKFTGGLHPYFKIKSRNSIKIYGLESSKFKDSFPEVKFNLSNDKVIERLYFTNTNIIFYNGYSNLLLKSKNFDNWMIWNPGKEGAKKMQDLPDDDWDKFICIEPVITNIPKILKPQEKFISEFLIETI